jgi:hypothetical protein
MGHQLACSGRGYHVRFAEEADAHRRPERRLGTSVFSAHAGTPEYAELMNRPTLRTAMNFFNMVAIRDCFAIGA